MNPLPLDYLFEVQRDQVYDWLLDMPTKQVVEKLAQPMPEGFGAKTHVTTLRRFKDRRWAELAADHIQAATQFTSSTPEQQDKPDTGILNAIKHHMFQRASAHDLSDDQLAMVSRWSQTQTRNPTRSDRQLKWGAGGTRPSRGPVNVIPETTSADPSTLNPIEPTKEIDEAPPICLQTGGTR